MAKHNELGTKGEILAENLLIGKGYQIICRNWTYRKCEIDIIASDGEFIIFVEVKTRSSLQWENPEDAVSKAKIKRIVEAANYYLQEYNVNKPARFDIIAIVLNSKETEIEHFEDAFLAPINE